MTDFLSFTTWTVTMVACVAIWYWLSNDERTSNKNIGKTSLGLLCFALLLQTIELSITYL